MTCRPGIALLALLVMLVACGSDPPSGDNPQPTSDDVALTADQLALVRIRADAGVEAPLDVPAGSVVYARARPWFETLTGTSLNGGFPCSVTGTWLSAPVLEALLVCKTVGTESLECSSRLVTVDMDVDCANSCATDDTFVACTGVAAGLPTTYVDPPGREADTTCVSNCDTPQVCARPLGCTGP